MKTSILVLVTTLTIHLLLSASGDAQAPQRSTSLIIAGHAGQAPLIQIKGKSYVELESLARLTHGNLSFKGNQTVLTIPSTADADAQAPAQAPATQTPATPPQAPTSTAQVKAGLSRAFAQAGIEEIGLIREWRVAIVNAVQTNVPLSEEWALAQMRQAEKDQALASAAVSTDDDRNALPLLSAELNNMHKLNDQYFAMSKRDTPMSPDVFDNDPLEQQILSCARGFVAMTERQEFQDQAACH